MSDRIEREATSPAAVTAGAFRPARAAVLIDGPSLRRLELRLDRRFAYDALAEWVERRGYSVATLSYYTSLRAKAGEYSGVEKLLYWLRCNGYHVCTVKQKEVVSTEGTFYYGSALTWIVADGVGLSEVVDRLFIFSGNAELVPLVEVARRNGCPVTVVSAECYGILSSDLKEAAGGFLDLSAEDPLFRGPGFASGPGFSSPED